MAVLGSPSKPPHPRPPPVAIEAAMASTLLRTFALALAALAAATAAAARGGGRVAGRVSGDPDDYSPLLPSPATASNGTTTLHVDPFSLAWSVVKGNSSVLAGAVAPVQGHHVRVGCAHAAPAHRLRRGRGGARPY